MDFLKSKHTRDTISQFTFIGGLIAIILTFVLVGKSNLDAQGITSGFGFLERSTGWDISFSLIDYDVNDTYARVLLIGLLNTLFLGAISLTLATFIGLMVGVARTLDNKTARLAGTIYVETFRNIPLILQLLFWYAILTELPKPKEAINFFDSAFISGRGIYLPGLNIDDFPVCQICTGKTVSAS
jgi:general L-amino acid transport system permease protein